MKHIIFTLWLFLFSTCLTYSQKSMVAEEKFHAASGFFIDKDFQTALATVNEGLSVQPENQKLQTLKKILEQEQKKQQQQQKEQQEKEQQQKEQQQNKDKNKQDQQQENQNKDQQDNGQKKEDEGQKDKQQNKGEEKNDEKKGDQEKDKDTRDQDAKNKQTGDPENKEPDAGDDQPKPALSDKLEQMKMSPEKAAMILEAMKNQEKQYLQQLKRKPVKGRDKGKPDW